MAAVATRPPQLNLSRPAWNQGDVIDDLIEDTDRALRGLNSKAKHDGPDPKALKDAFLETSPHFQEMLQALESFDAANVPAGPTSSKYEQALFSALRTMLRECLFTKNAGLRKHHIDRVYTWYSDKRSKTAHGGSSAVGNLAAGTQSPRPLVSSGFRPNFSSASTPFESRLVSNLSTHVTQARNDAFEESQMASNPQQQDWKMEAEAVGTRSVSEQTIDPKERIQEYKMRNLRVSQMRRQGIPMEAIRAAEEAARHRLARPAPDAVPADEELDRKVKELWLKKREEEELERRSEQEVQEAMAWWASNRARVEEEISRRQESIRFASQTARLHSRPTSAISSASRALSSARPTSSRPTSSRPASSRPASSRPASSRPMSARFISGTPAALDTDFDSEEDMEEEEEEDVEVIEDFMQSQPLPEKFQRVPILKAPYDGLRQSVTPAGWAASSAIRPISARLAGQNPDATHNFGSPSLSSRVAAQARPQTANARITFGGMAAYEEARDVNLVLSAKGDAFELHGFQSPHVSLSRPSSAYRQSQASTMLNSPADSPRAKAELLLRGASEPTIRTNQLTEVDRIKRAFARTKLVCPVNVIERALVVPQDRCYAKCVEQLPRAGGHLLADPIAAAKKASKGKKGAKGKGKKGAKKGGKKKKK